MRVLHFAVAAVAGFLLYVFVVVFLGGFLSAAAIPIDYFQFFGSNHQGSGQALLSMVLHALPTSLLIAGGVLATERFFQERSSLTALPYGLGMLSCILVLEFYQPTGCLPSLEVSSGCTRSSASSLSALPWWAWAVIASPWFGLGLAAWLLKPIGKHSTRSVA
jgi:hypothetical protein